MKNVLSVRNAAGSKRGIRAKRGKTRTGAKRRKTYADAKRGKANDLYQEREDAKPVLSAGKHVETKSRLIFILLLTG